MSCKGKVTPVEPLTGMLDTRSLPSDVPFGAWRWRQNMMAIPINKLCRRSGWRKLMYGEAPYQNHDLHDQLLSSLSYYDEATPESSTSDEVQTYPSSECGTTLRYRTQARQPITLLYEGVSTTGARRLLAGTQNRLYVQRASRGNWQVISDALGGELQTGAPERRWKAAQVNDAVIFVNGYDTPVYWSFDQPIQGCDMQGVAPVPTLEDIGLTTAAVVYAWKGIVWFGDVEMDAERIRHRVVWSGINKPLAWVPGSDTIAGFQDLDYGERILKMLELGDFLMIYTTKGIWQVAYVGGEQVFAFQRKYFNDNGDQCLAFPNTLVSIGDSHLYMARDGIHIFNQFLPYPERPTWIHAASGYLYNNLNTNVCETHVAHYDAILDEVWISYVKTSQTLPSHTLVINVDKESKSCDYVDHGFTAMVTFNADLRPDTDTFVLENCICSEAELTSLDADGSFQSPKKEGVNCTAASEIDCDTNTSLPAYTSQTMDLDGRTIENYFVDEPTDGSLCDLLGDINFSDLCSECDQRPPLVLASATDYCLKEYADVGYRERCTSFTACGAYVQDGYESILTTGPIRGKTSEDELKLSRVGLQFQADVSTTVSNIILSVGISGTPTDPNGSGCPIRWRELSGRLLQCASTKTEDEHIADATKPFKADGWQMMFQGRNLYLKFSISGKGGLACFNQIAPEIEGRLLQPNA
jgi:hypothetical protein